MFSAKCLKRKFMKNANSPSRIAVLLAINLSPHMQKMKKHAPHAGRKCAMTNQMAAATTSKVPSSPSKKTVLSAQSAGGASDPTQPAPNASETSTQMKIKPTMVTPTPTTTTKVPSPMTSPSRGKEEENAGATSFEKPKRKHHRVSKKPTTDNATEGPKRRGRKRKLERVPGEKEHAPAEDKAKTNLTLEDLLKAICTQPE